jgi:PAS domain S-box-containing protein
MSASPIPSAAAEARTPGADIIDSIDVPIITVGGDCVVSRFNPAAATLLSLTPADLGRPIRELRMLTNVKRLEELCGEAIGSGASSQCEVQDATNEAWFVLRIAPYIGNEQRTGGAVLTLQNVTAFRASLEQAIHEREYTKAILNTVIDPLVVLDENCRVQAANQAFYARFQVSREQAHGVRLYDIGSRDWEIPRLQRFLKETHAHNQSDALEFEHEFPALGRRTVLLNARRLSQRGTVGQMILLGIQDITERKQTERATGLLAAIVDSSDDAIVSKSLDGVITSWNKGAERTFGYTAEEAVGQHITLIIPQDRRDEETDILQRLQRGKRIEHFDTVRVRKDGKAVDISLTISPVKDAQGRAIGASKVARDVTERKRVEQTLRESEERLRTLAEGLETQVRFRTRELEQRNSEVLQQSEQLRDLSNRMLQSQDDERRHIARELHDSAGQIVAALGMSLTTISQHGRKDPVLAEASQDCQELVQQLSKEIRTMSYLLHPPLLEENGLSGALRWYVSGLAERSGLDIRLTIPENFERLPDELELVMFRLVQECLTNIHRHSGSKNAAIRIASEDNGIYLEVHDEGKGIPAEKLAQIQSQGAGVGIRGMRERVRHLQGDMNIESNGSGTRISVRFPAPSSSARNIKGQDFGYEPT